MEKYLITGFSGFVSKHFLEYLDSLGKSVSVLGVDVNEPQFDYTSYGQLKCSFQSLDLLDSGKLNKILYDFQPAYILHLASYSSVAFSWKNPLNSFANNTNIFLSLLEQVRGLGLRCRILSVGSSEEYGNVSPHDLPLLETSPLKPLSPYAVARVSQEMLSKVYVDGYGLDIILTRSFNHIGPGQREVFVVSSFAKQLTAIKINGAPAQLVTGDLSIVRDFLDVRDVVRAYHTLFMKGRQGEIYNICSGTGTSLEKIILQMEHLLGIKVEKVVDKSLVRPNDNPIIIGSNAKIRRETNWEIKYDLTKSLADILNYWQKSL